MREISLLRYRMLKAWERSDGEQQATSINHRSEERRVGKEWRSRWSP